MATLAGMQLAFVAWTVLTLWCVRVFLRTSPGPSSVVRGGLIICAALFAVSMGVLMATLSLGTLSELDLLPTSLDPRLIELEAKAIHRSTRWAALVAGLTSQLLLFVNAYVLFGMAKRAGAAAKR